MCRLYHVYGLINIINPHSGEGMYVMLSPLNCMKHKLEASLHWYTVSLQVDKELN